MRIVLDACVLYPTVLRQVLIGLAKEGFFMPLWSDRILEEWARAAKKLGETGEMQARSEIAMLNANWPGQSFEARQGDMARLYLPDENDIHVLATAVAASADAIITLNIRDFPKAALAEEGVKRLTPDEFAIACHTQKPDSVSALVQGVFNDAKPFLPPDATLRNLMKRAKLPRLGKVLA